MERVSYFSVVGNLVLFCTNELALSSDVGVTVDLVFIGSYSAKLFPRFSINSILRLLTVWTIRRKI